MNEPQVQLKIFLVANLIIHPLFPPSTVEKNAQNLVKNLPVTCLIYTKKTRLVTGRKEKGEEKREGGEGNRKPEGTVLHY